MQYSSVTEVAEGADLVVVLVNHTIVAADINVLQQLSDEGAKIPLIINFDK